MVEVLLVVTIALGALCLRRLGVLLRRGEESHAYLEARLADQIRTEVDTLSKQVSKSSLNSGENMDALAQRIVEASRSSWEALDAIGRRTGEEAQRTRRDLLEALTSLQLSVRGALGEMKALHEQALRELRRPIRQAVAIRQEIRRGRDRLERPALEEPLAASPVSEAVLVEDEVDPIHGPEGAGERPVLAEASSFGGGAPPLVAPDAEKSDPLEREPGPAQTPSASPRPGRFVELLSRVRRRTRRPGSTRTDTQAGH